MLRAERAMAETWKALGVVAEGTPITLAGINLWSFRWTKLPRPAVDLPHPQYQAQRYMVHVFEIRTEDETLQFAAAEVSAGVWAFYRPSVE